MWIDPSRRRFGAPLVCCALAGLLITSAGARDFVDVLPEKPNLLVYVPSLERLTKSLSAFGHIADIPPLKKMDAKDLLEDVVGRFDGLDLAGPFAVLVSADSPREPVVYLRLSDAAAWKTANAAQGEKILSLTEPDGDQLFAIIRDDVLLLSTTEAALEDAVEAPAGFGKTLEAGKQAPAPGVSALLWVDVAAWAEPIARGLDFVGGLMRIALASAPNGESVSGMMDWYFGEIRALAQQSERFVATTEFSADGVRANLNLTVKDGGPIAKFVAAIRLKDGDLLRGLPDQPFLAALGADYSLAPGTPTVSEYFMHGVLNTGPLATQPVGRRVKELAREISRQMEGVSFSMARTPSGMEMSGNYWDGNAARLLELTQEQAAYSEEMTALFAPGLKTKTRVASETLAGQPVMTMTQEFSSDDPMVLGTMSQLFGGASIGTYWAEKKGEVVFRAAGETRARDSMTRALKGEDKPLSAAPRVRSALARLKIKPLAVALVDVVGLVQSAAPNPTAPPPPPDAQAPLLSIGATATGRTLTCELFAPADMIPTIKQTVVPPQAAPAAPQRGPQK